MLSNYLKIAVRNLVKHKSYTFINVFGLITGLASAMVLIVYAHHELSFDSVHEKRENIFLVYKERKTPNGVLPVYDTWVPTLEELKNNYPDIVNGARSTSFTGSLSIGEKKFEETLTFADPSLFELFTFSSRQGKPSVLLKEKSSLLLSKEMAAKLFGESNALNQIVHVRSNGTSFDFTVAGILDDVPINSSIRPSLVVNFENAFDISGVREAGWNSSFLETYILLDDAAKAPKLEEHFPTLVKKIFDEETATRMEFKLLPFSESHNQFTNSNRLAIIMLTIAAIILIVAVINYVNLATVRSIERAKEIGLRKALGASRLAIARQFLAESFGLTALGFIGAFAFLQLTSPLINELLGTQLEFNPMGLTIGIISLALLIVVGVLSGGLPALFISRYKTVESIKGKLTSSPFGSALKKTLIVVQFSFAIVLLFGTFVIYEQVEFMKKHDLGFRQDHVLVVPTDADNMTDPETARRRVSSLKKELMQTAQITHVSSSNIVPTDVSNVSYILVRPDGWTEEQPFRIQRSYVDESYFSLYDVPILEGQNFREGMVAIDTMVRSFSIINEAALKAFGWQNIDGKKIGQYNQVVGLVADHHYANLAQAIEPAIFVYRATENQASTFLSIRFDGSATDIVPMVQNKWQMLDESRLFTYFFVDKNFDSLYRSDERNFRIITWFSGLTIIISCLGLLGLISYSVNQRTKEIGIRKVLGSSALQILVLLTREFALLITFAVLAALPLAYFLMNKWLQDFSLRVEIPLITYVVVAAVAFFLALLTTSLKAWRVVRMNPTQSLRSE